MTQKTFCHKCNKKVDCHITEVTIITEKDNRYIGNCTTCNSPMRFIAGKLDRTFITVENSPLKI